MTILHYSLGLFPSRSGGLNRYATDLMIEQAKNHKVALLYPNGYNLLFRRCYVSKQKEKNGIILYRLVNAHPIPLFYGLNNPKDFTIAHINRKSFECFYNDLKPDILHLHTLMGIPRDVISFLKEKGVKVVYTSHDYFGICPKVNLVNEKGELCEGPDEKRCAKCNAQAPSSLFLRIRSSSLAYNVRDFCRWLKKISNH